MTPLRMSVIVPTHNRSAMVLRLLKSLARHHSVADGCDVIVVADACTDDTVAAIRNQTWPFDVEVLETSARGAGAARNAAARRATGDLLVFLDDDLEIERTALTVHAAAHASGTRLVGLGYLPPVIAGHSMFAKTLRGRWEALFDEPRRPGHRYDYRNLLTGHFSIRRDRFLELGGFDETLTCHEGYDFGYRALRTGLTFRFLPNAVTWHHDTTTLSRALQRKRAEGIADARLALKHPELIPSLPLWRPREGGRLRRLLVFLAWHVPLLGDAVVLAQRALMPMHEALGLRFRWRARAEAVQAYWYWRGVAAALGQSGQSLAALHAQVPPSASPGMTVDLAEGIAVARDKLDRLRPASARVVYGERFVGLLPATPGSEPLCGRHLAPFVARFMPEEFLAAAIASGAMPRGVARTLSAGSRRPVSGGRPVAVS